MKLKLYEFRHKDFDKVEYKDDYIVFVISTKSIEYVRNYYNNWDSGDTPFEIWREMFEEGTVREINSIDEIDFIQSWQGDFKNCIAPYTTDDEVFCEELGGDYLWDVISIGSFFNKYYGKEFPDN